jgi:adenylate cyclase
MRGQEIIKTIGAWLPYTSDLRILAWIYLHAGMKSQGLAVIDEALAKIGKMGGWNEEPELHRLQGELLLLNVSMEEEAEACFQRGIEVAKAQKAKSWELRVTMSLCRLLQKQGKQKQARTQLSEVYNWFTEGFDTPDLIEAKSLLEALS